MSSLTIIFFHQGLACNGDSSKNRPLGGTESAMIDMAAALARLGHRVCVFTEVDAPGNYSGVEYYSWRDFESFAENHSLDIFICLRQLLPLMARRWAKVQIYFSPDAYDQPFLNRALSFRFEAHQEFHEVGLFNLSCATPFVDAVFCVGEWQAQTFCEHFKISRKKIHVVHNGFLPQNFSPLPLSQRKRQIVYASTPFRGLEYLLKYFPQIRSEVPDATCQVMSGMQIYGMSDAQDQKEYSALYQLADQPGVKLCSPLPKPALAVELSKSRVMAYPNTFAETFCMAVLEAQAAGLPVVTTSLAGLQERIEDQKEGFLISGHPSQEGYREKFITAVVRLLKDDALWLAQSALAQQKASSFSYDRLSKEWEKLFFSLLHQKDSLVHPVSHFVPKSERVHVLVNGVSRPVDFSAELLHRLYREALTQSGFVHTAQIV